MIKYNTIIIILDTILGLYCQGQTQPAIVPLKRLSMIRTQEDKSHNERLFQNATEKYNNKVAAKEWTNTYHNYAKILALPTCLSKVYKNKTSVLSTFQGGGCNITQTCTNIKVSESNKSYAEGLNDLESWRVNKSKKNITRYVQDWWWCPKHKMEGKFDGMYINHPSNKHNEWAEEQ